VKTTEGERVKQFFKTAALGLAVITGAGALQGCTDEDGAIKAAESEGFTNIRIDGYKFFGCGDDDRFHTEFHATNAKGKEVHGVVCGGILKGSTVRILD
jgi:hypothetical protein